MKKITLGIALLMGAMTMSAQDTVWEDGFETYDDFAISDIGDWTQIDNDGDSTYGITDVDFENSGYTGTGIIFNSANTTPSQAGGNYDAHTGAKGLFFFTSTGDVSGVSANDDYFISPQIDLTDATESQLTFWAKSLTDQYGLEQFEILLSTTGTDEADFTVNLSDGVLSAPVAYTKYVYDLAAYDGQQVYFAIHYVSEDTFVLQMDDFRVGQEMPAPDAPGVASNPTPEDGATIDLNDGVDPDTGEPLYNYEFGWDAPANAEGDISYVYYVGGTDVVADMQAIPVNNDGTTISIAGLQTSTDYFWAIAPSNESGGPALEDLPVWSFTTSATLGLDDVQSKEAFSQYVQNDVLNVESNTQIQSITLFNILGQQIASQKVNDTKGNVSLSQLNSGVYLAKVQMDGQTKTFKFVK